MDKLETLSARELGTLVNAEDISPTEVIRYFADYILCNNEKTNSFVYMKIEEALQEAQKKERHSEEYLGPFAGVPFGLKDFLPSKKGWVNTHGGVKSLTAIDEYDSVFCSAMEQAGGIAVGKTNAPAFGFRGTTDNKLYGVTKNPFNLKYNAGGSSGGSAAAVASGLVPISEGGDAGGSIRIPAAWCNCYGFKASFGSIPNICRPDAWSATHPYCTPGGLTKTVEDAAILLSYMSRYDRRDPLSVPFDRPDYLLCLDKPFRNVRIAFTYDFDLFPVDQQIKDKVRETAKIFEQCEEVFVEPVHFNFTSTLQELEEAWCTGICVDSAVEDILRGDAGLSIQKSELPEDFLYWNERTKKVSLRDYYKFHKIRTEVYDQIENVFDKYDLLISPVSNCLPVENTEDTKGPSAINGVSCNSLIGFAQTFLLNFTGHPSASVPAGLSDCGLPIGMQIIGKRFRDETVLQASHVIETIKPWRHYYDIARRNLNVI